MKKGFMKALSVVLSLVMLLSLLPAVTLNASASYYYASGDWSNGWAWWSQNQSKNSAFRNYGCYIVAKAKLLVLAGVASDDPSVFNPDIYFSWEIDNGQIMYYNNEYDCNISARYYTSPSTYAEQRGKTLIYEGRMETSDQNQVWNNIYAGKLTILRLGYSDGDSHYVLVNNDASLYLGRIRVFDSIYDDYDPPGTTDLTRHLREIITFQAGTHSHDLFNYVCPADGYYEPLSESAISGTQQSYIVCSGGANVYNGPYTQSGVSSWLAANTPLTCVASAVNKAGQTWYKLGGNYSGKWILGRNAVYHPASDLAMYLSIKDNPMTEGNDNALIGNVSNSYYAVQVTAALDGQTYYRYKLSKGNLLFQNSELTSRIGFDSLEPGRHTVTVTATDEGGGRVEKSVSFTVNAAVAKPYISKTVTVGGDERSNEGGGKLITLACNTPGAEIYYTLDGSIPTEESIHYNYMPFKVTDSCVLRARAFLSSYESAVFTDEITIHSAQTPEISTEDVPEGTRVTIAGEENAIIYYRIGSGAYVKYKKPFIVTEDVSVSAYSRKSGCKDSAYVSSMVTVKAPDTPVFLAPVTNEKYAQNSTVIFKWSVLTNAAEYLVKVYWNDTLVDSITVTEPNASVCLENAGTYAVTVTASNAIGSSAESERITAVSVAPLTVRYEDYDGTVVSEQLVEFGGDAVEPTETPERRGYFFLYWDGSPSHITADTTINAVYRIRSYEVTFYDENDRLLGHKQTVEYMGEADVPAYNVDALPTGYAFLGWNVQAADADSLCDPTRVDSDMRVTAVVGWYERELPLLAEIVSATRDDASYTQDTTGSGNYNVTVKVTNWPDSYTTAMLRVSLKTAEDKMVKTEARTIGLRAGAEDEYEFVLNYSGTATQVEVVAIGYEGNGKTGSALSKAVSANVSVVSDHIFGSWSEWSTNVPSEKIGRSVESRTLYRSRTRQTKTIAAATLNGWTASSSKWRQTGSGTHYYFIRPSGFAGDKYLNYASSALSNYETATTKRVINSTSFNSYIYWHWTYPLSSYNYNTYNRVISDTYGEWINGGGNATLWYAFDTTDNYSYDYGAGAYYAPISGYAASSYWWYRVATYRQTYTDYTKYTTFYKWNDWSDWGELPISASDNVQVKTMTQYRYKDQDVEVYADLAPTDEDISGEVYSFTGILPVSGDADLSGKLATVMVYKGKNSDPNESQLQYVGQTVIGEHNTYDFAFKTKEEPTIDAGDYIVSLGLQGATGLVNVGMINAPKPQYTVSFYAETTLVDTQLVEEGGSVVLPAAPQRAGYRFVAWSETGRNVHGDMIISAIFVPVTYAVAFVDWVNGTVSPFALEYGTDLTELAAGMTPVADGHTFLYWDAIHDGNTTVTQNMVISAVYEANTFTVRFYDGTGEDKNMISSQEVAFGDAAELPDDPVYSEMAFLGWATDVKWWDVRSDMDVYPILVFNETAANPVSMDGTYLYGMQNTITLLAVDGASIYYTIDGTEPIPGINGLLYNAPIQLSNESILVKAIAVEENKNNSEVVDIFFNYAQGNDYEIVNEKTVVQQYSPIVKGGDSLTLNIGVQSNPGLEGYLFFVECDPSVYYMEYSEENGYSCASSTLTENGTSFVLPYENGWQFLWFNTEAATGDGPLFSINLKVNEGIPSGSYPITISYSAENMIVGTDEDEFDMEFDGTISGAAIIGDVNGDNDVTLADVILIAKYKAGLYSISELSKLNAADVNRDGSVTLADVVYLARYIIGLESSIS